MMITEILIRAKTKIKPTHLMSDTRLSYTPCFELVDKLLKLGFLEIIPVVDNRSPSRYRTTDKGNIFIERVLECYAMIEDDYWQKILKKVRA